MARRTSWLTIPDARSRGAGKRADNIIACALSLSQRQGRAGELPASGLFSRTYPDHERLQERRQEECGFEESNAACMAAFKP
jgi:hypothetical protein